MSGLTLSIAEILSIVGLLLGILGAVLKLYARVSTALAKASVERTAMSTKLDNIVGDIARIDNEVLLLRTRQHATANALTTLMTEFKLKVPEGL